MAERERLPRGSDKSNKISDLLYARLLRVCTSRVSRVRMRSGMACGPISFERFLSTHARPKAGKGTVHRQGIVIKHMKLPLTLIVDANYGLLRCARTSPLPQTGPLPGLAVRLRAHVLREQRASRRHRAA